LRTGAVEIDDALLQAWNRSSSARSLTTSPELHGEPGPDERAQVGEGIHQRVDPPTDPVADRHRAIRQDEIGAGAQAPDSECLPESSRLFSIPQYFFPASKRPPMPAVLLIRKRPTSRPAPPHFPGHFHRRDTAMLSKPFLIRILERLGHDHAVDLRHRLQDEPVEVSVDLEHRFVELLPGVVVLVALAFVSTFSGPRAGVWGDHRLGRAVVTPVGHAERPGRRPSLLPRRP